MFEVHISKHSLFRLKITVGCLTSTYPSIHVETLSRSRSVVWCVVWCVCVHVVLCGVVWCCVVLCACACVWCVVKLGTLSLSCSLSFLFSFPFFFSLNFLFSLFFFLFSCSFSYSCSCSCSFSFSSFFFLPFYSLFSSLLFTPTNTVQSTDQQTRRPTLRHLNVMWRTAGALQSVSLSPPPLPSLLPSHLLIPNA